MSKPLAFLVCIHCIHWFSFKAGVYILQEVWWLTFYIYVTKNYFKNMIKIGCKSNLHTSSDLVRLFVLSIMVVPTKVEFTTGPETIEKNIERSDGRPWARGAHEGELFLVHEAIIGGWYKWGLVNMSSVQIILVQMAWLGICETKEANRYCPGIVFQICVWGFSNWLWYIQSRLLCILK